MRLFGYISGKNESSQKMKMTTPVLMEPGSLDSEGKMGFVLPAEVAKAGAPTPSASNVTILKRAGGRFAVVRFPGVMDAKKSEYNEAKLRAWLKARGLQAEGTAERAGYDSPFTPGPLRRNEILIRLKPAVVSPVTS
jgi:hypothetical protein